EREERGDGEPERRGERQDLPGDLLPDLSRIVATVDLEIPLEQFDHRQIAGCPAVGDRDGLGDQPAVHTVGMDHLPDEPPLSPPPGRRPPPPPGRVPGGPGPALLAVAPARLRGPRTA